MPNTGRKALQQAGLLQGFFFVAFGAGIPFFSLYYRHVLLLPDGSPAYHLIGLLFFLQALMGVTAAPLAGYLCDRFRIEHRLVALFSLLVAAGSVLIALPGFDAFRSWSLAQRFLVILPGVVLNGLFFRSVLALIDTETLNVMHRLSGSGDEYGKIRAVGSFGWTVSAIFFGWILSRTGQLNHTVIGYGAGYLVLALIASRGFRTVIQPVRIPWEHLKKDRMFQFFLVFVFIQSFAISSSFTYTSYLMEEAGTGYLAMGLAFGLASLPEVPILFYSGRAIRRFGNRRFILFGTAVQVLKLSLFVLIGRSGGALTFILVQVLHGIGFSIQHAGMINLTDRQAHNDLRATYQNLYGLSWTMAMAFAGYFGAFMVDRWGTVSPDGGRRGDHGRLGGLLSGAGGRARPDGPCRETERLSRGSRSADVTGRRAAHTGERISPRARTVPAGHRPRRSSFPASGFPAEVSRIRRRPRASPTAGNRRGRCLRPGGRPSR